jgi:hypothetical protein
VRKQIELLEYHSDLLTHMVNVSFRRRDVNALEVNFSAGWNFQTV